MAKRRRKSRRSSTRRRGRNAWRVRGAGRRKGSVSLYWKKRKYTPRKSRKGSRKGKRKSKRNRRYNKHRRRNPGLSLSKPFQAVTAGYNVGTITKAGVITAGVLGNAWLSGMVSGLGFVPSFLKHGIGSYAVGLGTAGLLGAGTAMLSPKYAGEVFFGGVLGEVTRAVKEYLLPMIPGMHGFGYFGDYLTPQNAASATPLGYFGDYLTPANAAAALPLHGFSGDDAISEELAVFA